MTNNVGEYLVTNIKQAIATRAEFLRGRERNGATPKELHAELAGAVNTLDTIVDDYLANDMITNEQYSELDDALDDFANMEFEQVIL